MNHKNHHRFLLVALALLLSHPAFAQALFQRSYGGTSNPTFTVPVGSGFFSATTDQDFSQKNALYLFRTDSGGDTLWTRKYTHPDGIAAQECIATSDGGFAICGFSGNDSGFLLKTDANGAILWCQSYLSGDRTDIRAVEEFPSGGFAVTGGSQTGFDFSLFLMRTDAQGSPLWMKRFGGQSSSTGWTLGLDADANIVVGGDWEPINSNGKALLMRLDSTGTLLWAKTYDTGGYATLNDLQISSNNILATGSTESGPGESGILYLRLAATGDTLVTRAYGWLGFDEGRGIVENADGSIAIAGVLGLNDSAQVALLKVSAAGQLTWFNSYLKGDYMESYSIAEAAGGYLVSASDEDQAGSSGAYLFRTDALGQTSNGSCNEISRSVSIQAGVAVAASITPPVLTGGTSSAMSLASQTNPDTLQVFCIGTSIATPSIHAPTMVSPQPLQTGGHVTWSNASAAGECRMVVSDVAGRQFQLPIQLEGNHSGRFEADFLAPGLYGFRIEDARGRTLGLGRFLKGQH